MRLAISASREFWKFQRLLGNPPRASSHHLSFKTSLACIESLDPRLVHGIKSPCYLNLCIPSLTLSFNVCVHQSCITTLWRIESSVQALRVVDDIMFMCTRMRYIILKHRSMEARGEVICAVTAQTKVGDKGLVFYKEEGKISS